jgi:3-oxoacyl-[acyl-carrier-protein] synthase II
MEAGSRVVITGTGILSGGAGDPEELWKLVVADGKSAAPIADDSDLASIAGLSRSDALILGRHQMMTLAVVEQAWKSAGLDGIRNRLRGEGEKRNLPGFSCVGGSSVGGLVAMENDISAVCGGRFSPYAMSRWRGNAVTAVTALRFGLGGTVLALNAASASGAQILWMAGSLIRSGMAESVVAVAADQAVSPLVGAAMERNGSVAKDGSSVPLSGSRSGMTPSEGAACLILESEASARGRGARILARWLGGACANETHHLQAPDQDGKILERLIREQLDDGGRLGEADWVSLHATGTSRYDVVETGVLRRVFGEKLPWISAFKRTTGHALSASGLLEAALLVEGLHRGELPPLPREIDGSLGLSLPSAAVAKPLKIALQLALGMGGDVVVNLLGV